MPGGGNAARSDHGDTGDLLPLALSRPYEALARARAVLADRPGPDEASIAHQAAGIVLRDTGDVGAGVGELRTALRLARRTGSSEREADVLASLGLTLAYAGRAAQGLAAFDRALQLSSGVLAGQVLHRRGLALWTLGRYAAALDDLRRAVGVLRRADDQIWTPRTLTARGLVYLAVGSPDRADADFVAAGALYAKTSQELEAIHTVFNRAGVAAAKGDLPAALSYLDEAAARYRPQHVPTPFLSHDRCAVLLAAGLAADALAEADTAVSDIERIRGQASWKAELLLMAANSALAAGQPQAALDRAGSAARLFRSQQSAWWQAQTGLVLARARYRTGPASAAALRAADRVAGRLDGLHAAEATQAHLLAGRLALDLGRPHDADRHLRAAAGSRWRGPALSRASGWLSEALRAQAAGDTRRLLAACRRGLNLLDEHRFSLGGSELRAQATAHGAELAAIAQRHASQAHRPRLLLAWAERWRATALAVPAVRPPADANLSAGLAALRRVTSEVQESRRTGAAPPAALLREQRRLENVVRASTLRTRGGGTAGRPVSGAELIQQLGPVQLVEIVDVDGQVHVLTCRDGRVRQWVAGRTEDAVRAAGLAGFALRRLARNRPGQDPSGPLAILDRTAPELQATLLGPAAAQLDDDRPVVIVPPSRLHSIPWALLPVLGDRVFSVAPSAGAWLRARTTPAPARRPVTLARGPGLVTEGAEVPLIAPLYQRATVLSGDEATASRVLSALDGTWLAHIAAHGSFRADSPLFSSLRMSDGPLTVYDFEQLRRAPYWLVLPSCDSGVLAPAGADELLGLVSSLLPLGTAGLVASVAPLNDQASVPLMLDLHRWLQSGTTLAGALCTVRRGVSSDPVLRAAAWSLVTLGAG
jgi:CHAT domain